MSLRSGSARRRLAGANQNKCAACKSPMPLGAYICLNCKTDFSWRRYFTIGDSTLALLTALIAVIGATMPPIIRTIAPPDNFKTKIVSAKEDDFVLWISNEGDAPLVVSRATLTLSGPGFVLRYFFFSPDPPGDEPVVIPAKESRNVNFSVLRGGRRPEDYTRKETTWPKSSECELGLIFSGASNYENAQQRKIDCNDAYVFFISRWMDPRHKPRS
jgi:hypothetical protein